MASFEARLLPADFLELDIVKTLAQGLRALARIYARKALLTRFIDHLTMKAIHRFALRSISFLAFGSAALSQSTWHVDVNAPQGGDGSPGAPFDTLQGAIDQASTVNGDTLLVQSGTYLESIDYLGKNLTLRSVAGPSVTRILGQSNSTVVVASGESDARLEGFAIRGGTGTFDSGVSLGGGVYLDGAALLIDDCQIESNTADYGGGVFAGGGASLQLQDTRVQGNDALLGGGVHLDHCSALITGSFLTNNEARHLLNAAAGRGGGLYASQTATLSVVDTRFDQNTTPGSSTYGGGGIYTASIGANFQGCTIEDNTVGDVFDINNKGGGVWCDDPQTLFTNCLLSGNRAVSGLGGGFYGAGTLDGCTIQSNNAMHGGGLHSAGSLIVRNSLITANTVFVATGECRSTGGGAKGGVFNQCTFTSNLAYVAGGAAIDATLTGCTIQSNGVVPFCFGENTPPGGGGGIANSVAVDCLIRNNLVDSQTTSFPFRIGGGGAYQSKLTDCQLLDNSVLSGGSSSPSGHFVYGGGALDCELTGCRVEGNQLRGSRELGTKGGGIYGGAATDTVIVDNQVIMQAPLIGPALGGGSALSDLTRCVLIGNTADRGAGSWGGDLFYCTVAGNMANEAGGGLSTGPEIAGGSGNSSRLISTIVYANSPDQLSTDGGTMFAFYCDIQGGASVPGSGNIDEDPKFWGLAVHDVHLRATSPCIDAGPPGASVDLDGSRREIGARVFDPAYAADPFPYCQGKLNSDGCLPSIESSGSPSLSGPDDFIVSATNLVAQKATIAIWSQASNETPFFGGTLCLAPAIRRTPVSISSGSGPCGGVGSFQFNQSYLASFGLSAGTRLFAQFWQRDPASLDGTGVGLSNALDFTLMP